MEVICLLKEVQRPKHTDLGLAALTLAWWRQGASLKESSLGEDPVGLTQQVPSVERSTSLLLMGKNLASMELLC